MGCRSYGLSELWVVGVMGRRNRDLTPLCLICFQLAVLFTCSQISNIDLHSILHTYYIRCVAEKCV